MMEKTRNRKRNRLIVIAVIIIGIVFAMAGCVGAAAGGVTVMEDIPQESFAVINIAGTIQASPDSPLDGYSYNHSVLTDYVDQLMEDETNHGILLRVNSGGGTVYHSDEMYLKLMEYKEKTGRPVYAYFDQTAASGAYYISCAADYIAANRNCWTGSIGVIISYTNLSGLMDKLGVEEIIISTGANKGMGSSMSPLTDEQRAIYQSLVDDSYERFTAIVAQSRDMNIETVKALADGRVYTASQAVENGLVDRVATWEETLRKVEEETGVQPYEKTFSTSASWIDYILYGISEALPKSDMQVMEEMVSSQFSGVPMYYMVG
ncbi:MAG: signal peptide peptidase SppA [Oscillospiraceae bacterium]|nr:signal peptide peptidase SppA [Oscillospiraceae bacterium]